jgi:hypothetical protein
VTAPGGQTVAPGDTRKISVKMSTVAYTSDLHKEIKIETNDPNSSLLTLTMNAKVFAAMKVSPMVVTFGRIPQNQTVTREFTVENRGKKPLKVSKINVSAAPQTSLAVTPDEPFILKSGESRKFTVKLSTGTAVGFLDSSIVLETDNPFMKQKRIFMSAEVKEGQAPAQ